MWWNRGTRFPANFLEVGIAQIMIVALLFFRALLFKMINTLAENFPLF